MTDNETSGGTPRRIVVMTASNPGDLGVIVTADGLSGEIFWATGEADRVGRLSVRHTWEAECGDTLTRVVRVHAGTSAEEVMTAHERARAKYETEFWSNIDA